MQRSSFWLLPAALALNVACQGVVDEKKSGADADDDKGIERPPVTADSLNRNPDRPLVCDDSKVIKPGPAVLARLTNEEYVNTLRPSRCQGSVRWS